MSRHPPQTPERVVADLRRGTAELLAERTLQRRYDRKYAIATPTALELIRALLPTHLGLPAGPFWASYLTLYMDSPALDSYHDHRRARPRRTKARIRVYEDRDLEVLEVKMRNGRGWTEKTRQQRTRTGELTVEELAWLREAAGRTELVDSLNTRFQRLTLLGESSEERITIDLSIEVGLPGQANRPLRGVALVEVKTPSPSQPSDAVRWLHRGGHRPAPFSKYCVGTALLRPDLPHHRFALPLRNLRGLEASCST